MFLKQGRGICFAFIDTESPKAHAKTLLFDPVDDWRRCVVTLHGPIPVIVTVLKVADATVGVAQRPTGDQFLSKVSLIVAIDVFQIDCLRAVLNNGSTTIEFDCRWDT